jgi:hypothetical protein
MTLLKDYFEMFLKKKPAAVINEEYVVDETSNGIIIHNGIYTFDLTDTATGKVDKVPARFTYVYKKQDDGEWKIQLHHSSALPEPVTAPEALNGTTATSIPSGNTTRSANSGAASRFTLVTAFVALVASLLML